MIRFRDSRFGAALRGIRNAEWRWASAGIASLILVLEPPSSGRAQSPDFSRLQSENSDFDALLRSLEGKIPQPPARPPAQTPVAAPKPVPDAQEPGFFADKKIHIGGVTITPGGFIAAEGLARDRQ